MNPAMIPMLLKGANTAYKYLRSRDDERERDIYASLLDGLKSGDHDDIHEKLDVPELERAYGAARANAGDITRDLHDRLDRRRASYAATAPAREAYRKELLKEAEAKKKEGSSTFGTIVKWTLGLGAVAGGAYALWEFLLKDKFGNDEPAKTYTAAPTRTETDREGNATLVYSTRTEDEREAADQQAPEPGDTGRRDLGREGLSTLDTLDDDQRDATTGER